MDLSIKYQLLSKKQIFKFTLNRPQDLIACIIEGNQYVSFYSLKQTKTNHHELKRSHSKSHSKDNLQEQKVEFEEVIKGSSKPLALMTSLAWSPNGSMLALGTTKVEIWNLSIENDGDLATKTFKIAHNKYFNEDFTEIRMIKWTPDSTYLICTGVHKTLSIAIRNVVTGELKTISLETMVASISFDPFGKYLIALTGNNKIRIYTNLTQEYKVINLSKKELSVAETVKEVRGIDWSPDYSCLVVPSLQDNKIPLAVNLSRTFQFKATNVFIGHHSPINSIKFNPKLFRDCDDGKVAQIVALGDTSGLITIWKLKSHQKSRPSKPISPLLLSRAHQSTDEVIEQMEWNEAGTVLLVNCQKSYLSIYKIDTKKIGKELTTSESNQHLEELYGVASAQEISAKRFEVFMAGVDYSDDAEKDSKKVVAEHTKKPMGGLFQSQKPQMIPNKPPIADQKTEYVKTEMKVIMNPNKTKTIVPSMMIPRSTPNQSNGIISSSPFQNGQQAQQSVTFISKTLRLRKMTIKMKPVYRITENTVLQIKTANNNNKSVVFIQLLQINDKILSTKSLPDSSSEKEKVLKNQRAFQAPIDHFQILPENQKIIVINQKNLYIFDKNLNISQLPVCVGNLYRFCINEKLDIYGIATDGTVRGYSLGQRKQICSENNIGILLDESCFENEDEDPVESMRIRQSDHRLYIRLRKSKHQYFLDTESKLWKKLEFTEGNLLHGHSLRISDRQERLNEDFFSQNKQIKGFLNNLNTSNITSQSFSLSQLEYNLVYFKRYSPNQTLYGETLISMIKELSKRSMDQQLRDVILKHFFDSSQTKGNSFIQDKSSRERLWKMAQRVGGKVIQEFVLMNH